MAKPLTQLQVKNITPTDKPKRYHDGDGLYLNVTSNGAKSWVFRFMKHGKATTVGLGRYPEISLADARISAADLRKKIHFGFDPVAEKRTISETARAENKKGVTFDWCASEYIKAHSPSWSNLKHADQWRNTIKTYATPTIGEMDVAKIETSHIMSILEPIWQTKAETASRVRGRIENILDWAAVHKHRTGENPARLKGHIEVLLPARNKKAAVRHHPALPFNQLPSFMTELRKRIGIAARAVEFGILTGARSSEIRGMVWSELDDENDLWILPQERMKAKREHRVPLSAEALKIIADMKKIKNGDLVFPGMKIVDGKPITLSDMTLTAVLKRMDEDRTKNGLLGWRDKDVVITMHGFRSCFRDWTAEKTDYPSDMAEMALAHTVSNQVEAAYRRGDMMEKRRAMMQAWADYSSTPTEIDVMC